MKIFINFLLLGKCSPLLAAVDVKSWLVMFGFQLSNIIPGFPRHSLYFVEPPYELQATQHCENGQVRTLVLKAVPTEAEWM